VFFPAKICQFDKTKNIGKKREKKRKNRKKKKRKKNKEKEKNIDTGCEKTP
jgi:hypothetical protein